MFREIPLPNAWLQQVGFKLGNPFSTREAAVEPESALVRYFVPHPSFDDILGSAVHPRSGFLVAKRGCGKTTSRRVIEWHCRSGRMDGPVLAVPYTEFSVPLRHADENGRVPVDQHVTAILRQGLPLLMDALAEQSDKTEAFIGGLLEELAGYLGQYTDLLTKRGLDKWLQEKRLLSREVNAAVLLKGKVVERERPLLRFLVELLSLQDKQWDIVSLAPNELLAGFIDQAQLAGYQAIYLLLDRVDEREPMASSPERAADLLELLVTNLPIMELKNTAFKLFITPEIMSVLKQRSGIRLDRLLVRDISWSEASLQYLLDRRVEVFTEGTLPSLDAVSDSGSLVSQMADKAQGSPRSMLRLAEWLLYCHYVRVGDKKELLLKQVDYRNAIAGFEKEQATPAIINDISTKGPGETLSISQLRIDESAQVWRGNENLGRLPKLQHKLLSFLLTNRGLVCTHQMLIDAVYDEKSRGEWISDERINKLVRRLRQRIEVDASNPQFIITVPGMGYILEKRSSER